MTSQPPLERSRLLNVLFLVRSRPWLFPVACFLRMASWIFYVCTLVRKLFLRSVRFFGPRVQTPVISVGSVTVGGAGKTPVLLYLMEKFSRKRVGYISRGYGRLTKDDIISYGVTLQLSSSVGDEAFLIAKRFPSLLLGIGAKKRKTVKELDQKPLDILFLDDGLQRYDIPASLEIGVLPEQLLFEPEQLFPAGLLRESLGRLKKVDLLFVMKENPFTPLSLIVDELRHHAFERYVIAEQQCTGWIDTEGSSTTVPTKKIAFFSAIARPERVHRLLKSMGYEIVDTFLLGDHETLLSKKFSEWASYWNRKGLSVIGTEKDWARHVPWPKDLHFCSFLKVDLSLLAGDDLLYSCIHKWL